MTIPFIWHPSKNFNERPVGVIIDTLVLHYTDMPTAHDSLERLCDPAAKVSTHYLIDRNGHIYHLVNDAKRAWHAGVSSWQGRDNVNDFSIGIELQNFGYNYFIANNTWQPYTSIQMGKLVLLIDYLRKIHPIPLANIVGHNQVAPGRKFDPGPHFDWDLLRTKIAP
jgi:N-acetylmuramoyl-L-alanine amidase